MIRYHDADCNMCVDILRDMFFVSVVKCVLVEADAKTYVSVCVCCSETDTQVTRSVTVHGATSCISVCWGL
jgi:hypothetical protein